MLGKYRLQHLGKGFSVLETTQQPLPPIGVGGVVDDVEHPLLAVERTGLDHVAQFAPSLTAVGHLVGAVGQLQIAVHILFQHLGTSTGQPFVAEFGTLGRGKTHNQYLAYIRPVVGVDLFQYV